VIRMLQEIHWHVSPLRRAVATCGGRSAGCIEFASLRKADGSAKKQREKRKNEAPLTALVKFVSRPARPNTVRRDRRNVYARGGVGPLSTDETEITRQRIDNFPHLFQLI